MQPGERHPDSPVRRAASRRPISRWCRRRGTVMVFVLGVLALLALLGLVLIARTHGEFQRVTMQSASSSGQAAMDGVVRRIGETLRRDIWGDPPQAGLAALDRPLSNDAPPDPSLPINPQGLRENNEPWDAPGESDRWLGANMPYQLGTQFVNLDPSNPTPQTEAGILAWHEVSYLGNDINRPLDDPQPELINPFMWASNSRTPSVPGLVRYDASKLTDVKIIQTPPPGFVGGLIPGSTTNVTIRQGRQAWNRTSHLGALAAELALPTNAALAGVVAPQYPYFDTNAEGVPDLYDADGDGVPDSPISFIIEIDSPDPNRPRQLYAIIRIVDHAGMLNVNSASALTLGQQVSASTFDPDELTFDETLSGLQRRGRRATEFLLDQVLNRDDWFADNRVPNMVDFRSNGVVATPDPVLYDFDVVRRTLIGGLPDLARLYSRYGLGDEASLRHRNMLVPFDRAGDRRYAFNTTGPNDYRNIDRALPSLLWHRQVAFNSGFAYHSYSFAPNEDARWSRLNADYQPLGTTSPVYEGYADGGLAGWRQLMDEDETFAVRRPMLTTINSEVVPPPNITGAALPTVDDRLRQLWAMGMDWPVLIGAGSALDGDPTRPKAPLDTMIDRYIIPPDRLPPDWARVLPVDINMSSFNDPAGARADFVRYTAAATYMALEGLPCPTDPLIPPPNVQGMPICAVADPLAPLNREYLAWQFAVNLADYRDSDSDPTYWTWPNQPGRYIIGVEKQPFFTEAYAFLKEEVPGPQSQNIPPGDKWFFAFELYVPPGWKIATENLYFRTPGVTPDPGLLPLKTFTQVTSGIAATMLDGGPVDINAVADTDHGNYYIFCGSRSFEPSDLTSDASFQARAYSNAGTGTPLKIDTDGFGRIELVYSPTGNANPDPLTELPNHVLDVIGPNDSGGVLAGSPSGDGAWAARNGLSPLARHEFSLLRSTKGWRFTTCWHTYSQRQSPGNINPGPGGFDRSLGQPNSKDVVGNLNDNVPESVWPAITSLVTPDGEPLFPRPGGPQVAGFRSQQPFETFDSVADLSRILMVGPVNLSAAPQLPVIWDGLSPHPPVTRDIPATVMLANALNWPATGDLPTNNTLDRVAAGRPDFTDARLASDGAPWTWRLFDLLTTQGHLFDGVDNDGDGLTDLDDPTEAADVLFRLAGRVNLNTAPATVLRSGPFMSLLPTSPEFAFAVPGLANPAADFAGSAPGFYWDLASAIVARRENREVALRLPDASGTPVTVAIAKPNASGGPSGGPTTAAPRSTFTRVIELADLSKNEIVDDLTQRDDLFQIDRFWSHKPLKLKHHFVRNSHPDLGSNTERDPFSPDFRYRPDNATTDYVPTLFKMGSPGQPGDVQGDIEEAAGIRGRDVYLSRLTNVYSTRSDCFTAYIALLDEDGHYVQRSQVTMDRSVCFREMQTGGPRRPILPRILVRSDGSYADDTK